MTMPLAGQSGLSSKTFTEHDRGCPDYLGILHIVACAITYGTVQTIQDEHPFTPRFPAG